MSSLWLSALALIFGAWHVAQGLRARRRGYIQLGLLDGLLLRGKWLPWKARFGTGALVVVLALVAMATSAVAHPPGAAPFAIGTPAGWVDVSERAPISNATQLGLNADAIRESAKGAAAFAGIVDEGRVTSFEARIARGPWEASLERLRESAQTNTEEIEGVLGVKPEFTDYELVELQGVLSGKYKATLRFPGRTMYNMTYVLPAADCRAFLTYVADARDYEKHVGEFVDVVQHARSPSGTGLVPPFPPAYLPVGGVLVGAIVTLAMAIGQAPAGPSAPPPPTKRRRRKNASESGSGE